MHELTGAEIVPATVDEPILQLVIRSYFLPNIIGIASQHRNAAVEPSYVYEMF